MQMKFSINETADVNYLAIISKITKLTPIPNADNICLTILNGYQVIVKKSFQVGDIVVFFPQESCICDRYLSVNNLYGLKDYENNANCNEVEKLLELSLLAEDPDHAAEYKQEAKSLVGFFEVNGRVQRLKLRGEYSCGFVMPVESLCKAYPELEGTDWEAMVGTEFSTICGEDVVWKYVPVMKIPAEYIGDKKSRRHRKAQRKMTSFVRIRPDQFERHYESVHLEKAIREIKPDDYVVVTVKVHGTSGIFCNILCNRKLTLWEKVKKLIGFKVNDVEYGNVYSSRNTIKNEDINTKVNAGFYDKDTWYPVNEMLKPYLLEGMSVYGEIVGYVDNLLAPIQVNHDYGCKPGQWKFMPYRITMTSATGVKQEWNTMDVLTWTNGFVAEHPEFEDKIMPLEVVYEGKFRDICPDLDPESETYYDDFLERLKVKEDWLMEKDEPLCKYHKVPREGVVIRVENDIFPRAWKLKTQRHADLKSKGKSKGEFDMEDFESNR